MFCVAFPACVFLNYWIAQREGVVNTAETISFLKKPYDYCACLVFSTYTLNLGLTFHAKYFLVRVRIANTPNGFTV